MSMWFSRDKVTELDKQTKKNKKKDDLKKEDLEPHINVIFPPR